MARVVKDADVRRKELLDTALSMFSREGFERTSIDQITAEVGVAKGTFYHYFSSKQDLLEQLVMDWAEELLEKLDAQMAQMDGEALPRLRGVFANGTTIKLESREETMAFARSLYSDENIRLRHALMAQWLPRIEALLAPIIADGIAEGTFHVEDAEATATVLMSLWFGWGDRQAELILQMARDHTVMPRLYADLSAVEAGMERILGIPEGSLGLALAEQLRRFTEGR